MNKLSQEGGYGCTYYPGYNCDRNSLYTTKTISKVQLYNSVSKNEIFISDIICDIIDYKLYFLPIINSSKINVAKINDNHIQQCKIINQKDNHEYVLMNMPYIYNIGFENIFTDTLKSKKHILLLYIESFKYLCSSLQKLLDRGIIHFNIKEKSIIYDDTTEIPFITDFGFSIYINELLTNDSLIDKSNLKKYFYIYSPKYYEWSLEVHVISYLLHESSFLNIDAIKKIVSDYLDNNPSFDIFSTSFKETYYNMCINYLSQYIKYTDSVIIDKLIKFYYTWDMYSLSVLYLKYLGFSHGSA